MRCCFLQALVYVFALTDAVVAQAPIQNSEVPDIVPALSVVIPIVQPYAFLDPARTILHPTTVLTFHTPLMEQYIWTVNDAAVPTNQPQPPQRSPDSEPIAPHFFRKTFSLATVPAHATLYLAGPRSAIVFLNGQLIADLHWKPTPHMGFGTLSADVSAALRPGSNTLFLEAVRGFGSPLHTNAQTTARLNSGEVLVAKILPTEKGTTTGVGTTPILISDASWESSLDQAKWSPATSLGSIESSPDFFQSNADAGLYDWPGYLGESPTLANYLLEAVTSSTTPHSLLLDFGRELNGRILIRAGRTPATPTVRVGESLGELNNAPWFGPLPLNAAPDSNARSPKTGFRYALIDNLPRDAHVYAEAIFDPQPQTGSFVSSDPQLNRIFDTAAYTAHLAMQESLLDGIKRDRGRSIGADEVLNRVVATNFGASRLIRASLEDAIGPAPVTSHVNGLAGYSAWWIVAEYNYIQWSNDLGQLRSIAPRMLQLMAVMRRELDAGNLYAATSETSSFVDWATGFSADSPEARRAIHLEYTLAFQRAAVLLALAGRPLDAAATQALATALQQAAQKSLLDGQTYGDRWQTNALAILSNCAPDPTQQAAIWAVLARTGTRRHVTDRITPYFGSYLLQAMSTLGHTTQALQWMKLYWGGMIANGATSFYEAWDPLDAGPDAHSLLQADDTIGYYVSLDHGWSSGPAAWLPEQILGITPARPGFSVVNIHPDLAGLDWARGSVATPRGAVAITVLKDKVTITLPPATTAQVTLPPGHWFLGTRAISLPTDTVTSLPARTRRFVYNRQ